MRGISGKWNIRMWWVQDRLASSPSSPPKTALSTLFLILVRDTQLHSQTCTTSTGQPWFFPDPHPFCIQSVGQFYLQNIFRILSISLYLHRCHPNRSHHLLSSTLIHRHLTDLPASKSPSPTQSSPSCHSTFKIPVWIFITPCLKTNALPPRAFRI